MAYPVKPSRPPHGSTAWGAQEILRLLDAEEQVAAERQRLLASGLRPSVRTALRVQMPHPDSEFDGTAALHQQQVDALNTNDREARRRAAVPLVMAVHTTDGPSGALPDWSVGGRFGIQIPPRNTGHGRSFRPATFFDSDSYSYIASRSGGAGAGIAASFLALAATYIALLARMPTTPEEWEAHHRKLEAVEAAYKHQTFIMNKYFSQSEMEEIKAASGLRFDMLEPQRPEPPRDFDPEEARRSQLQFGNPPPSILPSLDTGPEYLPITEDNLPVLEAFPDLSDEIDQATILEVHNWGRRGKPETLNQLWDVQRDFEERHRTLIEDGTLKQVGGGFWERRGGVLRPETAIPGPGGPMKVDSRPGSRFPDLLYFNNKTGRLIAINTVDVDVNGNIEQRELDAANAMKKAGADVYLIRKWHQME